MKIFAYLLSFLILLFLFFVVVVFLGLLVYGIMQIYQMNKQAGILVVVLGLGLSIIAILGELK